MIFFNSAPFKRGNIISNGSELFVVNVIFQDNNGGWRMLIDTRKWFYEEGMCMFCKEVSCNGFYKVK